GKRGGCANSNNRYLASPNGGHSNSLMAASSTSKTSMSTNKHERSRHSNGTAKVSATEMTSLMGEHSIHYRVHPSTSRNSCHSSGDMCCTACPTDNGCPIVSCVSEDTNGCAKCAATGKCSTCCPYNRD